MSRPAEFAALHHGPAPLVLPNAWDVASALLLADAGAPAVGTTSLGVTAAAGLADGAGAGRALTVALAIALAPRLPVPLTVDLESGYSDDPAEVADLVAELAAAGVAGVNLEDGRADGSLRPAALHAQVVAAVRAAAPEVFVNARTDAYWLGVGDPAGREAVTRGRLLAYRDAGASGVFVPGLTDLAVTARLVAEVGLPLNVLWQPGALARQADAGVARVSTGSGLYRHATGAALAAYRAAVVGEPPRTDPVDYAALQDLLTSGR